MTKLINEKLVVLLPCQHAAVKEQEKELWNQTGTDLYGRPGRGRALRIIELPHKS